MKRTRWMLSAILTILLWQGAGVATAAEGERKIPACTHVSLDGGTCVVAHAGRLALLTDAVESRDDRCGAEAIGGGDDEVLCQFDGNEWREYRSRKFEPSPLVAAGAADRILNILNPPVGSGLVPPVGDGIDGSPNGPRTNDAPAITAAIQYACDEGYDIAYLGPGSYRIGTSGTNASFYSGVRIDAALCPNGIRFYGAGAGRTLLLANGEAGQYIVFTADEYSDATLIYRIGWNAHGGEADRKVTGMTTGVTPPVISGGGDSLLHDGDAVHVRNCSGVIEANERIFTVNNCTTADPYTCELQDTSGVDIDATGWSPWTSDTGCIVRKVNTNFEVEIAYMTLRDDDPSAHSTTVCDPTCQPAFEESHGIGILQGGGAVEVHHVVIDSMGDEAIDISAAESPTYIHDLTVLNPESGGTPVYQGVGVRIEDVLVHQGEPGPNSLAPYSWAADGFIVDPGAHNWRVVDLRVNRMVMTGRLRYGFAILTNSLGVEGQYISGVKVTNSAVSAGPYGYLCTVNTSVCGSFRVKSKADSFPIENVEVSGSLLTGTILLELSQGNGGVLVENNTVTPMLTVGNTWAIYAGAKDTVLRGNHVSGFGRGCVRITPYQTNDGANSTVTLEMRENIFECNSNATSRDPMIGSTVSVLTLPAPEDPGHIRIVDNQLTAHRGDSIRYGASIQGEWKGVEICRNTITIDESISLQGVVGIVSKAPGQLICDNTISTNGSGLRIEGASSVVAGNQIEGFDTAFANGITLFNTPDSLVTKNQVGDFKGQSSHGILAQATTGPQSGIRLIGNDVGAASRGIAVDGNAFGFDDVHISGNTVDLDGLSGAIAIHLKDVTDSFVLANELQGLEMNSSDALLTVGGTDFITVRDNLSVGGGTFRFGTTGGDASCNSSGGVGANSTCSDNTLQ